MKKVKNIILKLIAITVFAIIPVIFYGQGTEEKAEIKVKTGPFEPYWFTGGHIGGNFLFGDFSEYEFGPGGDMYFGRQFTPIVGLDVRFYRAIDEDKGESINRTFDSDLYDFTINAKVNLSNLIFGFEPNRLISVHGLIGFGQVQFRSRLYEGGKQIRIFGDENSPENDKGGGFSSRKVELIVPVGFGVDYALTESWDLNLDVTWKLSESDILDASWVTDSKKDVYAFLGVGTTYKLGYASDIEKYDPDKFEEISKLFVSGTESFDPYWFAGGHIGGNFLFGDVSEYEFGPGGDMYFGRQLTPIVGLDVRFYRAIDEDKGESINRTFDSDLYDFTINAKVNLSNLIFGFEPNRLISVHGLIGFGQVQFRSRLYEGGKQIRIFGDENSPENDKGGGFSSRKVELIVPVGFGVDYALTESWDLNLDVTWKLSESDILDASWVADSKKDVYAFLGVGTTYKLCQTGIKSMVDTKPGKEGAKAKAKNFNEVSFEVTPKVLEEHGEKVKITIKGNVPEKYFSKKAAMCLTPVLKYDGGETVLPSFSLKGEYVSGDATLINNETGGTFTYYTEFDYTPEMNNSELVIKPIVYKAKDVVYANPDEIKASATFIEIDERKIADGVIYTSERIFDNENIIAAYHGYEKETIVSGKAALYFQVNRFNLNWRVPMNKATESKELLAKLIDFTAKGWAIKDVEFNGWASPEGEETFNENLSENRSKTAFKYITRKIKQLVRAKDSKLNIGNIEEDITFNLNHYGPDWNGFLDAVKASDIEDKSIILNVVKSAATPDLKEQEIRNMIVIYPEIEENILPPLRRSEIFVNCYEPKFTNEEILKFATTDPSQLDGKELMYAATLTKDANAKLAIYKNVISLHPKCWSAYNNSGIVNLELGNYDKASKLFAKANELSKNNGKIYNNLGTLACKLGDYKTASKHFAKAKSLGENVDYNLGVIEIENGNYDKALTLFGNTKCDYNVALAQMMTGKTEAAEKTLKCTKDNTASTYYLLAIIGSRTANTSMMYEYLMKAIEKDPALKAQAKIDKEFINYENEADFIAIVK